MATIREISPALWRQRLRPGAFKRVPFYVEVQGRFSGRRIVEHEYPKRDTPWGEDMGRHAIRYQMTAYVIQSARGRPGGMLPDYDICRDNLCAALDQEGPGELQDPYRPRLDHLGQLLFHCERYVMTEMRERGGYAMFEMSFIEAGSPGNALAGISTVDAAIAAANQAINSAVSRLNTTLLTINT